MTTILSRREAMKAGAAFVLGFYLPAHGQEPVSRNAEVFKPNAWVRITRDNQITVLTEIPELGQGTRTANVMMLADELEVEWSRIQWEQAPTIPAIYKHLATGGSGGTKATWLPMRQAGAQVREHAFDRGGSAMGRREKRLQSGKRRGSPYTDATTFAVRRVSRERVDDSRCETGSGSVESREGFPLHRQTNRASRYAGQGRR